MIYILADDSICASFLNQCFLFFRRFSVVKKRMSKDE